MSEVLRLDGVTFRRSGVEILHGIDLEVRAGEHWALLGPNGAGKSTIIGFCGAQTHPTSGTVDVLGKRLGRVELQELRRHIGHVNPRHPLRSDLTVLDVVLTGFTGTIERMMRWMPSAEQIARAQELVALVGLDDRTQAHWPTMSQGERGRSLIARALAPAPELLLLDEPLAGTGHEESLRVIETLQQLKKRITIMLIEHDMDAVFSLADRVSVLVYGRVIATDTPERIRVNEEVRAAYLGEEEIA